MLYSDFNLSKVTYNEDHILKDSKEMFAFHFKPLYQLGSLGILYENLNGYPKNFNWCLSEDCMKALAEIK